MVKCFNKRSFNNLISKLYIAKLINLISIRWGRFDPELGLKTGTAIRYACNCPWLPNKTHLPG